MEILLNIDNEEVTVSLALTKTSLHNRNLVAFGPTTLRATICYNMLRLCRIKNGDFICDPMCGTSAIPIESAVNWVNCYHFGGDFHEKAIERTITNISAIQEKLQAEDKGTLKIDAVQWNIQHFPLRDKCVDVFVSDLPFGHRMGSRTVNRTLYPCLLSEMARTARSGARACLLTEDKTSLIKAIQATGRYWQRRLILSINIGGLSGFVFLLTRTAAAMAPAASAWRPGTEDGSAIAEQNDLPAQDAHDQVNGASTQGEVVDVAATEGEKGSGASAEAETSM
ncbi:THUMP domain-containing protein 3 [Aplysia californica]|uniref:THUMP domain-containing protein 3 n=1 Tax=Aplysia californica TaxID=6500 RepID=A0ABM1A597_APLCA|nr:THUMP domain-containing protein 3 [Aplysia californica]